MKAGEITRYDRAAAEARAHGWRERFRREQCDEIADEIARVRRRLESDAPPGEATTAVCDALFLVETWARSGARGALFSRGFLR